MAKIRIEWVRLSRSSFDRGAATNDIAGLFGVQTLVVTDVATLSAPAPDFGGEDGFARIFAIDSAVNVAWGAAPVASDASGLRIEPGSPAMIGVTTGEYLSVAAAGDSVALKPVQDAASEGALTVVQGKLDQLHADLTTTLNVLPRPVTTDAVSRSSVIAVGGVAQDLMAANPARKGWELQNQSGGDLYVRSKGAAGSMLASLDQNSLKVAPGALYVADAHVTPNALSIIGAAAGQAFYAREW